MKNHFKPPSAKRPLNICLLSYRSNPHSGGQGVYLKNLSRGLADLGHKVEVVSGPPDPVLDDDIVIHRLPGLDLYNPEDMFRVPTAKELTDPVNLMEWIGVSTMGFPEPFTFGLRAYRFLQKHRRKYDIIHDNQCLSYGIWGISRILPTVITIHHPITVDLNLAMGTASAFWKKVKHLRWHSFITMQKRVARRFSHIITVSKCARNDISRDFHIPKDRFRIVLNGIRTDDFHPLPEIQREKNRIIVTNSADIPLKGLYHLLRAVAEISKTNAVRLIVVGTPKKNGGIERLVKNLSIGHLVNFTGRISKEEFVRQYARASVAVIPSMYEGFGLPAGEAMACGVPVVSTTGGALPEVVGKAGILIPPGDAEAIAKAVLRVFRNPEYAEELGRAGLKRVERLFTWERAAKRTVAVYRKAIDDYRGF